MSDSSGASITVRNTCQWKRYPSTQPDASRWRDLRNSLSAVELRLFIIWTYLTDDIDVSFTRGRRPNGLVSFGRFIVSRGAATSREGIYQDRRLAGAICASIRIGARRSSRTSGSRGICRGIQSIFSSEHLAAELLRSGRLKDHVRVVACWNRNNGHGSLHDIIRRHGLTEKWKVCRAFTIGRRIDESTKFDPNRLE